MDFDDLVLVEGCVVLAADG